MEIVLGVLLALAVVAFIGYPLVKEQLPAEAEAELSEEAEELYRRKEATYSALKELEFDFKTGKLSETDYHELEERYRSEAVEVLEAIDLLEKEGDAPPRRGPEPILVEAEGAEVVAAATAETEPPVARGRRSRSRGRKPSAPMCPECGSTRNPPGALFCADCGTSLAVDDEETGASSGNGSSGAVEESDDSLVCEDCGAGIKPEHRFCGDCGAEVAS
jgi:hypothetical protein